MNVSHTSPRRFPLGTLAATPGVLEACSHLYLMECLARHARGDWGDICPDDAALNDAALRHGSRILSAYPLNPRTPCTGSGDDRLWIITEADRSATTFLLPSEY